MLRKDRGFLLQRAILEMEGQPAGNFVAMGRLSGVAIGNNCTVQRAQKQKPAHFPFRLPYRHRSCRRRSRVARRLEQRRPSQHEDRSGWRPESPALMFARALLME
jgi:hypothetical protein